MTDFPLVARVPPRSNKNKHKNYIAHIFLMKFEQTKIEYVILNFVIKIQQVIPIFFYIERILSPLKEKSQLISTTASKRKKLKNVSKSS